jgi:ornithine cyclodeaminase
MRTPSAPNLGGAFWRVKKGVEAGDLVQAIAEGAITEGHVVADLAALCRGAHPGRQSADQITAFKSVGWAGEDLAAAVLAYGAG